MSDQKKLPEQPPPLPPSATDVDIQAALAELRARVDQVEAANELLKHDKVRRWWGYAFQFAAAVIPLWPLRWLMQANISRELETFISKVYPPEYFAAYALALCVAHASAVVAASALSWKLFVVGKEQQIPTLVLGGIESQRVKKTRRIGIGMPMSWWKEDKDKD